MKILKRAIAVTELLLIFPAALFMTALFLRNVQPEQYQPARTAQLIVNWFTKGPIWLVLWVLLMAPGGDVHWRRHAATQLEK